MAARVVAGWVDAPATVAAAPEVEAEA
jgi:hypothetical protein